MAVEIIPNIGYFFITANGRCCGHAWVNGYRYKLERDTTRYGATSAVDVLKGSKVNTIGPAEGI
jgi:hypothetical protein